MGCEEDLTIWSSQVVEKIISKNSEEKKNSEERDNHGPRRFRSLHEGGEQWLGPQRIYKQNQLHNFQGPVQNKNAGPLLEKLWRISTQQQQINKPSVRPFWVGALCDFTGHISMKPALSTSYVERVWANVTWPKDQTTLKIMFCFLKTNGLARPWRPP